MAPIWTASRSQGERLLPAAVAILAVSLFRLASVGGSDAHAGKKKRKRAATAPKKCKKPKAVLPPAPGPIPPAPLQNPPSPPPPPPPPPPVLRIEIEWAENADVDIHVWNSTGTQHASTKTPNGIPGVSFSADDTDGSAGGGLEQVFAQPNDKLIVGICNNGSEALRTPDIGASAVVKATAYVGLFARTKQDLQIKPSEGSWAITSPDGPELPPGAPYTDSWCFPKRAEISWDNAADVDLHVFDALGNHASPAQPYGIPNAYLTADVTTNPANADWEEFFDQNFESKRDLYFFYCVQAVNGAPAMLWEIDFFRYVPPFIAESHLTQAPPTLGDHGFMGSIENGSATGNPP